MVPTTYQRNQETPLTKVDISQGAGSSASLLDNSMASRLGLGEKLQASGDG